MGGNGFTAVFHLFIYYLFFIFGWDKGFRAGMGLGKLGAHTIYMYVIILYRLAAPTQRVC